MTTQDYNVDVCVVGGNLNGLLTAFMLWDLNKKVILIEKDSFSNETLKNEYALDHDFQKLLSYVEEKKTLDAFQRTLDAIYQLDYMNYILNDQFEFKRCPSFQFLNCLFMNNQIKSMDTTDSVFHYKSKLTLNPKLLYDSILHFLKDKIPIYDQIKIKELKLGNELLISTHNDKEITCKKLIITNEEESRLLFDVPNRTSYEPCEYYRPHYYQMMHHTSLSQYGTYIQECYYISSFVEKENTLHIKEEDVPYIKTHEEYTNISFNIDANQGVLFGLMGAIFLASN